MARSSAEPRCIGIFPDEAAMTRPGGAILFEQNDERDVQRFLYINFQSIGPIPVYPIISPEAMAG